MPPFPGIPYGAAPAWCFPLTELCIYVLFMLCLRHAFSKGVTHVYYLAGGFLFGFSLEYLNVNSNMGYTYGQFMVMLGKAPYDMPLWIGVAWGIIMYSARLFSDAFSLPLWTAAAVDTLLAINIDISVDTVAYRLHMWHWSWAPGENPLSSGWFGIPYGNFFGWLMVVFFYSSSYRLLERMMKLHVKGKALKAAVVPLLSVIISQIALYGMLVYVDRFLYQQFGVTPLMRCIGFLTLLVTITVVGRRRRKTRGFVSIPLIAWLVPLCFHLYFFALLFIEKFYLETPWLAITASINLFIGLAIHLLTVRTKIKAQPILADIA